MQSDPMALTPLVRLATSATRSRVAGAAYIRHRPSFLAGAARHASNYYAQGARQQKKGVKIGHVFSALALVGISATAYGLYDFYQSFTAYPSAVRSHLRTALRAANDGSILRSSDSFAQAYDMARELAVRGQLASTRQVSLMRTTGIAVRWGAMWEQAGELVEAITAYQKGLDEVLALVNGGAKISKAEMMRGVAISMKIGDLNVLQGTKAGEKAAEERYSWCVQEMMRLNMTGEQLEQVRNTMEAQGHSGDPKTASAESTDSSKADADETDLPSWLDSVELVAGMERLGELYARQGRTEYAQPLLQQTIALLIPPPKKEGPKLPPPPIANRCHAATLMNNLSSVLVSAPSPNAEAIDASSRWARQALTVSNSARKEAEGKRRGAEVPLAEQEEAECQLVAVVGAYNLGKLSELSKDKKSAKAWFEKSRNQAARIGSREGVERSLEAIRRL